jgi:phospholipid-binding lipoprotein MlaA
MSSHVSIAPWFTLAVALATAAPAMAEDVWDPWESLNRATFSFNAALAKDIAAPVVAAYQSAVPQPVQTGLDDFFTNLREPVTAVSSGLQGDFQNAGVSVGRFAINSTVGIVGLFDVATDMGWVSRPEDLGATLCTYRLPPGPYFVVPILGPTTAREAVGSLATFYILAGTVTGDATVNYLVTDRVVSTLATKPATAPAAGATPAPAEAGDAYVAQRDAYAAFRDQVCNDAIPAKELKPNPFGSVAPAKG